MALASGRSFPRPSMAIVNSNTVPMMLPFRGWLAGHAEIPVDAARSFMS